MLSRSIAALVLLTTPAVVAAEVIPGPEDLERFGVAPWSYDDDTTAAEWYVTWPGVEFSARTIANGRFLTIDEQLEKYFREVVRDSGRPPSLLEAFSDGPIYLGYYLHDPVGSGDAVYGWSIGDFAVNQFLTNIQPFTTPNWIQIDSAAAVGENGIIVGTLQAVPEPAAAALIGVGLLAVTVDRRRRR